MVEQDHRGVKRVRRPLVGVTSFHAAQDTLVGIELLHMSKQKQMVVEAEDESLTAADLFSSLVASSPHRAGTPAPLWHPEQHLRQSRSAYPYNV